MSPAPQGSDADATARLGLDHEAFTQSLERTRDFAVADDRELVQGEWNDLEAALLRHLGAEEAFLIPGFARDQPVDAERLLAEHTEIRAQVGEVGLAVDLHILQLGSLDQLYRTLARHIARETRTLYPWAAELRNRPLLDAALRRIPDPRLAQEAHDEQDVAKLLTLMRVCRDGEQGYRRAALDTTSPTHRAVFVRLAEERARFARSLRDALRELGFQAQLKGSTLGSIHRGWMDATSRVGRGGERVVLRECERGEGLALGEYRQALRANLAETIRPIIETQSRAVRCALDELRGLAATAA